MSVAGAACTGASLLRLPSRPHSVYAFFDVHCIHSVTDIGDKECTPHCIKGCLVLWNGESSTEEPGLRLPSTQPRQQLHTMCVASAGSKACEKMERKSEEVCLGQIGNGEQMLLRKFQLQGIAV
ncbi:hypothetical protein DdX_06166 [Ditylenchus destructor]|uniref:Uncharacterized protein n=1 Tax=Ditylenchus destructor TaxID=166010 RepID=A0AAD4NA94_9BILA|nr:hypothetical protein DdX_06166 [Ditylenchus destructor]